MHDDLFSAHEKMEQTCEMLRMDLRAAAGRFNSDHSPALVAVQALAYRELNTRLIEMTRKTEELVSEIQSIESGEDAKPTPVEDPYFTT